MMTDLSNNLKLSVLEQDGRITYIFSDKIIDILFNQNNKKNIKHIFILFEKNIVKISSKNNTNFNFKLLNFYSIEFNNEVDFFEYGSVNDISTGRDIGENKGNTWNKVIIYYKNHCQLSVLKNLMSNSSFTVNHILYDFDLDLTHSTLEKAKVYGYSPEVFTSFETKNEVYSFQDRAGRKIHSNKKIFIDWSDKKTYGFFDNFFSELKKEHITKVFYKLPFNPKDITFNYNNNIVNFNSYDKLLIEFQKIIKEKNDIKIICEENDQYEYPSKYFYSSYDFITDKRKILFMYLSGIYDITIIFDRNVKELSLILLTLIINDSIYQDGVFLNILISEKSVIFNNILSLKENLALFINYLLINRNLGLADFIFKNINNFIHGGKNVKEKNCYNNG